MMAALLACHSEEKRERKVSRVMRNQVIMVVVWGFGRFRNFSQKPPHTLCGFPPAGELPPVLLEALVNSGTSGGACAGLLAMVPKWVLW